MLDGKSELILSERSLCCLRRKEYVSSEEARRDTDERRGWLAYPEFLQQWFNYKGLGTSCFVWTIAISDLQSTPREEQCSPPRPTDGNHENKYECQGTDRPAVRFVTSCYAILLIGGVEIKRATIDEAIRTCKTLSSFVMLMIYLSTSVRSGIRRFDLTTCLGTVCLL